MLFLPVRLILLSGNTCAPKGYWVTTHHQYPGAADASSGGKHGFGLRTPTQSRMADLNQIFCMSKATSFQEAPQGRYSPTPTCRSVLSKVDRFVRFFWQMDATGRIENRLSVRARKTLLPSFARGLTDIHRSFPGLTPRRLLFDRVRAARKTPYDCSIIPCCSAIWTHRLRGASPRPCGITLQRDINHLVSTLP